MRPVGAFVLFVAAVSLYRFVIAGMQCMGSSSFVKLYDKWLNDGRGRRPEVEPELKLAYRAAWRSGDIDDRDAVLHYILLAKDEQGFDIPLAALTDPLLGRAAAGIVSGLVVSGYDLGPTVRERLEKAAGDYPDRENTIAAALSTLGRANDSKR
jgi:hypothetical protein